MNFKNIGPKFLNLSFDPGNKFSIPFLADPVGIVINTEKIRSSIVVHVDNPSLAAMVLGEEGFRILDESDLRN